MLKATNLSRTHFRGFTLIEIMVAVSIFSVVAVIATSALLSANSLNKKAQAIKLVMDNLNFALASMTLKMKQGGGYYCAPDVTSNPPSYPTNPDSLDCPLNLAGSAIAFKSADPVAGSPDRAQYIYRLYQDQGQGRLQFSEGREGSSMGTFSDITAAEIQITGLKFSVLGNDSLSLQPRILIVLYGSARVGRETSDFAIQTTVSDRR